MSDQPPFIAFNGGDIPPEIKAEYERHQMQAEDYRHGVARFFDELSMEHLQTFMSLMHTISGNTKGPGSGLASYYEGMTLAKLHARFGLCMGCGKDHDKLAESFTPPTDDAGKPVPAEVSEQTEVEGLAELTVTDFDNMKEYGLDDVRDEDTLRLLGFICINCKTPYVSIADRMQQPPGVEGCSGCRQKAKWG